MNDLDPAIDPTTADSLDELAVCLRRLHLHAGKPTYRSLEQSTKHESRSLPGTPLKQVPLTRTTLSDVLHGRKFPSKAFLLTFVSECGVKIENDLRWGQAWDRLANQHEDQPGGTELGQLRLQLTAAEARADQAVREAEELRRQLSHSQGRQAIPPSDIPFWDVLDPTEREILRSVSSVRTFAAGATIMEQGDSGDYVIVILGGRTSVRISENGTERVVAERGRGQLVGERAALQISNRSATVVALEMIWALAVHTRDFAAFLSTNPHILKFVQDQSRDRGTHASATHDQGVLADSPATDTGGKTADQHVAPDVDRPSLIGENCTVIMTDVVAFGAQQRNDTDRLTIRRMLSSMTQSATQGLTGIISQDRGDGLLIIVPPNVPTAKAMDQFISALPNAINMHNSTHHNSARVKLRLSVNVGPVVSDAMGVSGEAIITAARLIEGPAFKSSFVNSSACLGVIVSPFVYDTVIRHSQDQEYVKSYSTVAVEVKEFRTTAWMTLIS
jgi:CRP-like cAMP-binding protein